MSRVLPHAELTPQRPDWVADDAVLIAPVSGLKFPTNREINREFRGFAPNSVILAPIQAATSMAYSQIPHASEQGIFLPKQGIPSSEQGIFWAEQASQISASLSAHCGALAWPRNGLETRRRTEGGPSQLRWMRFLVGSGNYIIRFSTRVAGYWMQYCRRLPSSPERPLP